MKKFGTPIGAGPGSESENDGLVADGTPLPVGSLLAGEVVLVLGLDLDFDFCLGFWREPGLIALGPPLCVEVGCVLAGPEGCGVGVGCVLAGREGCGGVCVRPVDVVLEVEVELEVEDVVLDEPVVDDVVGLELVLVLDELELLVELGVELVVDELVVVAGPQLIVSDTTTPLIGSESDETGVPAGTLTGKVSCCPPSKVTVTVQASAEAAGIAASPRMRTADVTAPISFRLPNTVACLLLPSRVRMESSAATTWRRRRHATDCLGALQRRAA